MRSQPQTTPGTRPVVGPEVEGLLSCARIPDHRNHDIKKKMCVFQASELMAICYIAIENEYDGIHEG